VRVTQCSSIRTNSTNRERERTQVIGLYWIGRTHSRPPAHSILLLELHNNNDNYNHFVGQDKRVLVYVYACARSQSQDDGALRSEEGYNDNS
jgi:hypothetical protein